MIQFQTHSASHLITAYNQIMEKMRSIFELGDPADMDLQKALNLAKYQVADLGEVTAEEAHEISEYIKRDINDAAEYMMEHSAEFHDWLMLDIEKIERKVIDLFLSVADHTRIELEQFKPKKQLFEHATLASTETDHTQVYKSGEITGPGTLICESCGKPKPFLSSNLITDCGGCYHNRFVRRQAGIY